MVVGAKEEAEAGASAAVSEETAVGAEAAGLSAVRSEVAAEVVEPAKEEEAGAGTAGAVGAEAHSAEAEEEEQAPSLAWATTKTERSAPTVVLQAEHWAAKLTVETNK